MADFGYCYDCDEMNYAITDNNGVYERNKAADNHFGHNVHIFGKPNKYCTPIANVLTKLNANMPISNNEIIIFKLAIDLGELDKYNKNAEKETISEQTDKNQLIIEF